jgi:hypothetical protein
MNLHGPSHSRLLRNVVSRGTQSVVEDEANAVQPFELEGERGNEGIVDLGALLL